MLHGWNGFIYLFPVNLNSFLIVEYGLDRVQEGGG